MHVNGFAAFCCLTAITTIIGCASSGGMPAYRPPLEAKLGPGAKTGAPIPLHIDPNAKVVIATVPNLPAAPFSAAQATRGEALFDQVCASCHQGDKFIGKQFVDDWNDRRVGDFYNLIRSSMPIDNPGGLREQDYLDITAYLLKVNHAPASTDSLSPDTTILRGRKISVRQ